MVIELKACDFEPGFISQLNMYQNVVKDILHHPSDNPTIGLELELDELDLTSAESKATYKEIQEYVLKEHGLKVSNLYISQIGFVKYPVVGW